MAVAVDKDGLFLLMKMPGKIARHFHFTCKSMRYV